MNPESVSHEQRIVALPPELFRQIIQYLSKDRQALCAISLVCKFLQEEGQRQLYRRESFSDSNTPETHIKFLKSILDSNRLALLVREYTQYDVALDKKGTLWDYSCHGLQAMANLKRLHFRTFGGQPSAEILTNCTFQLRVLVWGNHNDEDHLSQFLLSQHSLRALVVDWAEDKRDLIPTSCCPRLSDLRGLNQGAVETFLPGRKITSLSWTTHSLKWDSSYKIDSFESFLPYLSQIRFLSLGVSFSKVHIRSIVRYFPRVEVFEFRHPAVDSHEDLALSCLKKLQILVISRKWKEPVPLLTNLFTNLKKLQQIHLFIGSGNYRTYRWTAGSLDVQPTLTASDEVHRRWRV